MFGNQSLQQYIFGNTKMLEFDLQKNGLRKLNSALHDQKENSNQTVWKITNPKGSHAIAVGIDAPIEVNIEGSTGYYCGGMNKQANINVKGGHVLFLALLHRVLRRRTQILVVRIELELQLKGLGEVLDRRDVAEGLGQALVEEPLEALPLDGDQIGKFENFLQIAE